MDDKIFIYVSKATAESARDRVLDAIEEMLKEGEDIYMLFKRVDEYRELSEALAEIEEREKREAATVTA